MERLLVLEGSGLDSVRLQYTADICNAMTGFIYLKTLIWYMKDPSRTWDGISGGTVQSCLPAAASAVGNVNLFRGLTSRVAKTFDANSWLYPRALSAAVATDQTEMVTWLLQQLRGEGIPPTQPA